MFQNMTLLWHKFTQHDFAQTCISPSIQHNCALAWRPGALFLNALTLCHDASALFITRCYTFANGPIRTPYTSIALMCFFWLSVHVLSNIYNILYLRYTIFYFRYCQTFLTSYKKKSYFQITCIYKTHFLINCFIVVLILSTTNIS